ncbi:response regulator [Leptolyngbya sp. CCY15150]|uniref:response regulator n=1 Tax=Leptolyngbya sp. CCY15150 TaxID=2767772 RepID=UPI00194EA6C6|nr:response regulator [Leptolyngbya sp. CCY15150]
MQGKLNEIDIRSIMQLIELGQRTGELFVEAYGTTTSSTSEPSPKKICAQSWFVFFQNGQIIYAGDSAGRSRLRDYLRRYDLEHLIDTIGISAIATLNAPEYGHVWALLERQALTPAQGRSIVQSMIRETLFDLLSLHQGSFTFEISPPLSPQLTTIEVSSILADTIKQIQEWKQFSPHIQSPDQCPAIIELEQLRTALKPQTLRLLTTWVDGKTSIRQMARYLNRDILHVARAIYPYVKRGFVQINPPVAGKTKQGELSLPDDRHVPRIVCIDDSATIRKAVEFILNHQGYEATGISNPIKALSLVFQLKPDLILCDIAMPELDGYEICAMLRKSTAFRQTPIVMLTGKDGFIDRVKARIVEATDYLTKPFGASELTTIVEKYVGFGQPDRPDPQELLAEAVEDELDIDLTQSASAPSRP